MCGHLADGRCAACTCCRMLTCRCVPSPTLSAQSVAAQHAQRLSVAYNNLAGILKLTGRLAECIQCYEHVVYLQVRGQAGMVCQAMLGIACAARHSCVVAVCSPAHTFVQPPAAWRSPSPQKPTPTWHPPSRTAGGTMRPSIRTARSALGSSWQQLAGLQRHTAAASPCW